MEWSERLKVWLPLHLFSIGGTEFTAGSALAVATVLAITYLAARILSRVATHHLTRHGVEDEIALRTATAVLQGAIWLTGIDVVLHLLGIRLTTLFATTGFLALGAGFGVKSIIENWLSGVIVRAGQNIRPGDVVAVDGQWLVIRNVGLRTTEAVSFRDEEVIVPNSIVAQSTITNLTRHDTLYRLDVAVSVSYESDLHLVRKTLEATLSDLEWRSHEKLPAVYLSRFGDSSVDYDVHVWVDDVRHVLKPSSDLHEAIWWAFKSAGIVMAFPQLGVHLDSPVGERSDERAR